MHVCIYIYIYRRKNEIKAKNERIRRKKMEDVGIDICIYLKID